MQVAYCIEDSPLASSTWTERLNLARVRLRRAVVGQMTHPTRWTGRLNLARARLRL